MAYFGIMAYAGIGMSISATILGNTNFVILGGCFILFQICLNQVQISNSK